MNQQNLAVPPLEKLERIEAIFFDCDGVLTDGGLFYSDSGDRWLKFSAKDGIGLALWNRASLKSAIISGRPIDIAQARFSELGVHAIHGKCHDKEEMVKQVCRDLNVSPEKSAFVGDDIIDLAAFKAVGLRIAVNDAVIELKEKADWILTSQGGQGAARECCETILRAQGKWPY
ncbi:MAG: HAD family hydrolase [Myxococcota bacterium]|nr:HAD family hydrolase [Myxococcota bacterium]